MEKRQKLEKINENGQMDKNERNRKKDRNGKMSLLNK